MQFGLLEKCVKADVYSDECESVHLWAKIACGSGRMLEVFVACLRGKAGLHTGNEHSIIINQTNAILSHHHIAILQVAMRNADSLKVSSHLSKTVSEGLHLEFVRGVLLKKLSKRLPFNPIHSDDWVTLPADANALALKFKRDKIYFWRPP
jgi:hypothetical protein